MADNGDSQKRNENNVSQAQVEKKQNEKAQEEPQQGGIADIIKNAAHPTLCMVLIGMKISAIVAFLILDWLAREAIAYLVVIMLGSADFWTTKNIAGRILVGLRWWNEVKEDGTEVWIYESKNEKKEHGGDSTVFWYSLYINGGVWLGLFIWDLIRLKFIWGLVALIMLIFAGTNWYGFMKCSKEQQNNILKFGAKTVMKVAEKGADVAKNQV